MVKRLFIISALVEHNCNSVGIYSSPSDAVDATLIHTHDFVAEYRFLMHVTGVYLESARH